MQTYVNNKIHSIHRVGDFSIPYWSPLIDVPVADIFTYASRINFCKIIHDAAVYIHTKNNDVMIDCKLNY